MDSLSLLRAVSAPEATSVLNDSTSKLIHDNVHGSIRVPGDILKLMHTPEFQRLHHIRQLGFCYLVFDNAVHTRFAHSLGVCYLAYVMCMSIRSKYPHRRYNIMELGLTDTALTDAIVLRIMTAALLHDVGHCAGSHAFDDIVCAHDPSLNHESRSIEITREICPRELGWSTLDCNFVASLIKPQAHHTGVLYQIVCNELNSLDVDKFDYLRRDPVGLGLDFKFNASRILQEFIIDAKDNIAYSKHVSWDILNCFTTRYNLHSVAYNHKTVKIVECMYKDILQILEPIFHISADARDWRKCLKYTDEHIYQRLLLRVELLQDVRAPAPECKIELAELQRALALYTRISTRQLYKCVCYTHTTSVETVREFMRDVDPALYVVTTVEIGYISSRKPDPFNNIYFYDNPAEPSFTLDKTYIDSMISTNYNVRKVLCICRDRTLGVALRTKWRAQFGNK